MVETDRSSPQKRDESSSRSGFPSTVGAEGSTTTEQGEIERQPSAVSRTVHQLSEHHADPDNNDNAPPVIQHADVSKYLSVENAEDEEKRPKLADGNTNEKLVEDLGHEVESQEGEIDETANLSLITPTQSLPGPAQITEQPTTPFPKAKAAEPTPLLENPERQKKRAKEVRGAKAKLHSLRAELVEAERFGNLLNASKLQYFAIPKAEEDLADLEIEPGGVGDIINEGEEPFEDDVIVISRGSSVIDLNLRPNPSHPSNNNGERKPGISPSSRDATPIQESDPRLERTSRRSREPGRMRSRSIESTAGLPFNRPERRYQGLLFCPGEGELLPNIDE